MRKNYVGNRSSEEGVVFAKKAPSLSHEGLDGFIPSETMSIEILAWYELIARPFSKSVER